MPPNDETKILSSPSTPRPGSMANAGPTLPKHPRATTEALLASLPLSVKSSLKIESATRQTKDGPVQDLIGCSWSSPLPNHQDLGHALSSFEDYLAPLTDQECMRLLTELRVLTVPRKESSTDLELSLKTYRAKLQRFPADAVRHVLTQLPEVSNYWPTWHELLMQLDPLVAKRQMVFGALHEALKNQPPGATV